MRPDFYISNLHIAALCLPLLAGCVPGTDRFTGPVAGCGASTVGVLDVRGAGFIFTPDQGVLEIHGTIGADGHLEGTATEGTPNSRDRYTLGFIGTRNKDTITGQLSRPGCLTDVTLKRH